MTGDSPRFDLYVGHCESSSLRQKTQEITPIWILWPFFIVAAIANAVFFSVFDPQELVVFGEPVSDRRIAIYSMGFFAFWAVTAASSAATRYLQRTSAQVNQ